MILQGNAVRALTPTGDWTMGNGAAGYLQKNAAVRQQVNCRLLMVLGECFWDLGAGVNWYGFLSGKQPAALSLALATVVLNSPNVAGLVPPITFELDDRTRKFSVSWSVNTIFSQSVSASALVTLQNLQGGQGA